MPKKDSPAPRYRRFVLKYKKGYAWKNVLAVKPDLNKKIKSIEQLNNVNNEFIISYRDIKAQTAVQKLWGPFVEYIEPTFDKSDVLHYSDNYPLFISHTCICSQFI